MGNWTLWCRTLGSSLSVISLRSLRPNLIVFSRSTRGDNCWLRSRRTSIWGREVAWYVLIQVLVPCLKFLSESRDTFGERKARFVAWTCFTVQISRLEEALLTLNSAQVMLSSISAMAKGLANHSIYASSKAAVEAFARSLAVGESLPSYLCMYRS